MLTGVVTEASLARAVRLITEGGVIVYPTDTVYGLGADVTNPEAVARVRACKGRATNKPILVMVAGMAMFERYAHITPTAAKLAERFLPGPLTMVLEARDESLSAIAGADGSVGFRMPDHQLCRTLCSEVDRAVTSTSVNRAGMPQPDNVQAMLRQLGANASEIDLVLDVGILPESYPSTIVDVRGVSPVLVRAGAIVWEEIVSSL